MFFLEALLMHSSTPITEGDEDAFIAGPFLQTDLEETDPGGGVVFLDGTES